MQKYIENSKILNATLKVYQKQPKVFNGRNFALEVNELLGINYEPDTIKRRLRRLREIKEINYEFKKGNKDNSFFGLYEKKDFVKNLQLSLF